MNNSRRIGEESGLNHQKNLILLEYQLLCVVVSRNQISIV